MKKTKILAMLLSLACSAGFYSCSDDDDVKPAIQNPVVSETAGAYNSLSFQWSEVENAVQYGYRLSDETGVAITAGVTHDKSVTITGLQPATTYTLEVWAFAAMDGDYSTPPAVTLTATTDPLVKLATPTNLTLSSENGYAYTAAWTAVENASEYAYSVRSSEGVEVLSKTTKSTSVSLRDLDTGDYTFSVYATGYDGYDSGAAASAGFHVEVPDVYTVMGTYYSVQFDASWSAYMDIYPGGYYTIRDYYGVEGYNLEFKIDTSDPDDMFSFINGQSVYDSSVGYTTWQVPTGLGYPSVLYTYPWSNYCKFSGDDSEGKVSIGNYYGTDYEYWGVDTFTWPAENPKNLTLEDLEGTYDCHFKGEDYISYDDVTEWDDTWTDYATVVKKSSNAIAVDGLFYTDEYVNGIVNFEEMTITFLPQDGYATWYTFAGVEEDLPALGYINGDGSITVSDFCLWYSGYWYLYGTSELTKSSSSGVAQRKTVPAKSAAKKAPARPKKARRQLR